MYITAGQNKLFDIFDCQVSIYFVHCTQDYNCSFMIKTIFFVQQNFRFIFSLKQSREDFLESSIGEHKNRMESFLHVTLYKNLYKIKNGAHT